MHRLVACSLALAAVLATTIATQSAAAPACTATETIALPTLEVTMEAEKRLYRVGETARIRITVTRADRPAGGVRTSVGLETHGVFLYGTGITDDQGKVTVPIEIGSYVPPGWVGGRALAQNTVMRTGCIDIEEYGSVERRRLFKVKR